MSGRLFVNHYAGYNVVAHLTWRRLKSCQEPSARFPLQLTESKRQKDLVCFAGKLSRLGYRIPVSQIIQKPARATQSIERANLRPVNTVTLTRPLFSDHRLNPLSGRLYG